MKRLTALLLAGAVLAGCGSTVAEAERRTGEQAGRSAVGEDGLTTDATVGAEVGAETGAGGATAAGGSSRTTRRVANATAGGVSTAVGPGVSTKEINLGLAYAVNAGAANAALGASGITTGDPKRTAEVVIEDINANGGVAGRKLVPVWHQVDGATTAPLSVIQQETCDTWTQDNKVFAAFGNGDVLAQCTHNRNVVLISTDLTDSDAAVFRRYPYYFELGSLNLDRMAAAEVAGLQAQNYFSGWNTNTGAAGSAKAKVGIVTFDSPSFRHATDEVLVPALRKIGFEPAAEDIRRVPPNARPSDPTPQAAAVQSAVLKLRSDGVTHVIVFDERAVLTLFFLQSAEAQGYRPRYGLNSQNGPQALKDGSGMPGRQLVGSKGIAWIPSIDLPPAQNPLDGPYSSEGRRRCHRLLTSKGVTIDSANAEAIAMGICTQLWFFRAAVNASGGVLNRSAFASGVAKLGTSFDAIGNFATRFSATQHDGVAAIRYFVYDESSGAMKYASGNKGV